MLRSLAFLAVAAGAAHADPVAMTVATHGSSLDVTFTNTSPARVSMYTHVRAGNLHYDWLTVELSDGKTRRTLHFVETRTKAIAMKEGIAPGASLTKTIDLVPWAIRAGNGDPLAPGTYELVATWDTTRETEGVQLAATARTQLTIAVPVEKRCTDAATTGLELLVRRLGKPAVVEVGLHNIDTVTHCVASYVEAPEDQNDWLVVSFPDGGATRQIRFVADRNSSAPVYVELAPGATAWRRWDLAAWAARDNVPLPHAAVWATATYDTTHETQTWRGKLTANAGLVLP